jgi:hypothetical protein
MPECLVLCWLVFTMSGVAPLSLQQRERLSSVVDGPDQRDDGFAALVEHVAQWSRDGSGDEPIRLQPDIQAMIDRPASFRGDLCRIRGTIDQQRRLDPPNDRVWEWFVRGRGPERRPLLVYVVNLNQPQLFRDGDEIQIDARFYKRVDLAARDGRMRAYPAFVGALPTLAMPEGVAASAADRSMQRMMMIAGPIIAMLIAFAVLMVYARRRRPMAQPTLHHRETLPGAGGSPGVDESSGLPDDPAEALAELKRRAAQDDSSR